MKSSSASRRDSEAGDGYADQAGRRTTVDIYADILEVVKRHGGHGRVTRISYGVGMPVDRLKRFLERLERYGLVKVGMPFDDDPQGGVSYLLSPRGQEFLDTYWKMKAFLDVFADSEQSE